MLRDEKNLKDSALEIDVSIKDTAYLLISYNKAEKLITALYMVTDIIDKDEPLRNKLRTLGLEILSGIHLIKQNNTGNTMSFMSGKISELLSFLDVAVNINIISEMNFNILKKEFSLLDQSIKDSTSKNERMNRKVDLIEFFNDPSPKSFLGETIGHVRSNSIGIQKGSTLLQALKKIRVSDKILTPISHNVFEELKKDRENNIVSIIKNMTGGATIKDIKDIVQTNKEQYSSLVSCGEKTLQRELVSMVKNGVLYKVGEKRWSKYFLK